MLEILDCIIVGRNVVDFEKISADARRNENKSGNYHHIKANTINYQGKRISYMDLLNQILTDVKGRDYQLNTAHLPNLGVIYLQSYLARRNFSVETINYFNIEKARLAELLKKEVTSVAISTTFYTEIDPIVEVVKFIRTHNQDVKIIVGGPHIFNICTYYDEKTQKYLFKTMGADIYIHDSQGEETLGKVLSELKAGKTDNLEQIPNLIYTGDGKTYTRTVRQIENNNLDENAIDWSLVDKRLFVPIATMRTSRSCPFSCAFCTYPHIAGKYTLTSLDVLEREFTQLKEAGVKYIFFTDDSINIPIPRFKDMLRMMIRNQFNFKWFSHIRCANLDDEAIDLMKESGCFGVDMGIESGNQTILNNMNKKATVDEYRYSIPRLNQKGIITFGSFIAGFPGETEDTIRNTIDFINETALQFYQVELYIHLPTTPINQRAAEFGLIGGGYSWKHNTMDWSKAAYMIEYMYENIYNSIVNPRQNFGAWAIPYLIWNGISLPQYKEYLKICHEMSIKNIDDSDHDDSESISKMKELFMNCKVN